MLITQEDATKQKSALLPKGKNATPRIISKILRFSVVSLAYHRHNQISIFYLRLSFPIGSFYGIIKMR